MSFQAFAERKSNIPNELVCAWIVSDSYPSTFQGVVASDAVSVHCVSKASIKRDELEIKVLKSKENKNTQKKS